MQRTTLTARTIEVSGIRMYMWHGFVFKTAYGSRSCILSGSDGESPGGDRQRWTPDPARTGPLGPIVPSARSVSRSRVSIERVLRPDKTKERRMFVLVSPSKTGRRQDQRTVVVGRAVIGKQSPCNMARWVGSRRSLGRVSL